MWYIIILYNIYICKICKYFWRQWFGKGVATHRLKTTTLEQGETVPMSSVSFFLETHWLPRPSWGKTHPLGEAPQPASHQL